MWRADVTAWSCVTEVSSTVKTLNNEWEQYKFLMVGIRAELKCKDADRWIWIVKKYDQKWFWKVFGNNGMASLLWVCLLYSWHWCFYS